jgi:hypothetical protein
MKYRTFIIDVLEQEPGKWRARVTREHGRPLKSTSRKRREFVSSVNHSSAAEAVAFAMEMVDAGTFTRGTERSTERYWRRLSKADRRLGIEMVGVGTFTGSTERSTERYWRRLNKADRKLGVGTNGSIEGISER